MVRHVSWFTTTSSGISSLDFSSFFGMVIFFSDIFGVLSAPGMGCSTFALGTVTVVTEGLVVGASMTAGVLFVIGSERTGLIGVSTAVVRSTPSLFFLARDQPPKTKRL
jgi:hypothetical protein